MRKLLVILAVLAILPAASAMADPVAIGDSVVITLGTAGGANSGGDFIVTGPGYAFPTFCIESTETFSPGGTYTIHRIDTFARLGSIPSDTNPDPLSFQTAYLYTQFRNLGSSYTAADAIAYQMAIWAFEEPGHLATNAAADSLITEANGANWTNLGDVRVLGFDGENGGVQDMLVLVPEPGSMLLLGTGLFGLAGALRRRLRK